MQGARGFRNEACGAIRRKASGPEGGAIEGNAADDAFIVDQGMLVKQGAFYKNGWQG